MDVELLECLDFRQCIGVTLSELDRQIILIGSNVLHQYFSNDDPSQTPAILYTNSLPPTTGGSLLPVACDSLMLALTLCCCSVLYNFEYITHPDQHSQFWQSWVSDGFVAVHKRFTTWDYSWYPNPPTSLPADCALTRSHLAICRPCCHRSNVARLRQVYDIPAVHVPMGWAPRLSRTPPLPEEQRDIDVLFYGTANTYREATLGAMAQLGANITWMGQLWGDELEQTIARAKIVCCGCGELSRV